MRELFLYAFNALSPIVLLIVLGVVLRKIGLMPQAFLNAGNKLLFRAVIPTMVFYNIYNVKGIENIQWDLVAYEMAVLSGLFVLGTLSAYLMRDKKCRGVIASNAYRSNFTIVGLPIAEALAGEAGKAVVSLSAAFALTFFNLLGVVSLSMFGSGDGRRGSIKKTLMGIVKNPLIIASLLGIAALGLRSLMPTGAEGEKLFLISRDIYPVYRLIGYVSAMCTPLSLIVMGGLLDFSAIKGSVGNIAVGVLWRNVIAPGAGVGLAVFLSAKGILHCGPGEFAALLALFGAPASVTNAIMAAEMGGDAELARQLTLWTSVITAFTLMAFIMLLRAAGLL